MLKHIVFEFAHVTAKAWKLKAECVLVLPAAFFCFCCCFQFASLLYAIFRVFAAHRLRAWFRSATKRWVSEVIHIMMCTVCLFRMKSWLLCMSTGNEKVFRVQCLFGYALVVLRLPVCVCICVLTLRAVHIYISVECERLTVKWGLATILNFMLYAFLLHVTVLRWMATSSNEMAIWLYVNAVEHWNWHRKCCCYHFPNRFSSHPHAMCLSICMARAKCISTSMHTENR